jgi:hypothetical protein
MKLTYIDKRLRPRNQALAERARMGGRSGNRLRRGRYSCSAGAASDIAAKEASGYGPPRLVAGKCAGPEPAPCAEPISEDGLSLGRGQAVRQRVLVP